LAAISYVVSLATAKVVRNVPPARELVDVIA
jgi:hypothetical protein